MMMMMSGIREIYWMQKHNYQNDLVIRELVVVTVVRAGLANTDWKNMMI
jgi:hypothetical protein